jgi:hypothetical protein
MKSFAVAALASSAFALPRVTIPNYPFNPVGYGPLPSVDTPEAFQALEAFSKAARSVATPSGYVRSYVDLNHTYDEPTMFVKYIELEDYDVDTCKFTPLNCSEEGRLLTVCDSVRRRCLQQRRGLQRLQHLLRTQSLDRSR